MKAAGKAAKKLYNNSKKIKKAFKNKGNAIVTRALPAIWKNKGKFLQYADGLGANSAVFAQVWAKSGDKKKVGAALKRIGKSCGGCHKAFRAKKM